ncbi:hypothetical protein [Legionella pneumophila]|uniref:hypothetical protein n=1 Tax=Legionella pneumophila TaxID=446 RepID=UPI00277BB4EE|nr:hypothetical protein [Legionella pneumophila]
MSLDTLLPLMIQIRKVGCYLNDKSALEQALNTGKEVDLSYLTFSNIEFSIASLFTTTPFKSLQTEEKEGKSNREEASIKKTLAEIERLENQINETHAQFIKVCDS